MDTKKILAMASKQVQDLQPVADNIYKGTLNIEDKIAGVYYFDLNNSLPENFEEYQEELLADEFYNNPGSRQWNYYLFLLNDTLTPERKKAIERDDRYARKFVLNEGEFEDFFQIEEADKSIQHSIVTRWKEALDAVDLQEVYGGETYVDIFERFCSNNTRKAKSEVKKGSLIEVDRISFVNRIVMKENYRRFPKEERDIRFGKVNLLHGINGVGKTSTFEAIELLLCGATFRNKYQINKEGCVEAELNHTPRTIRFQTKNPSLYQSRDLSWYSNTNNRGNTLYNSFNRFNYFNADAALQFSGGGSEEEISNALFNIVLGPEYTYIQERSLKMLSRISPAYKKLETELEQMKKNLRETEKILTQYKEPLNLQTLITNIVSIVKSVNFINPNADFTAHSAIVEQENSRIQVILAYFVADNFRIDSFAQFQQIQNNFEQKKSVFNSLIERIKGFNNELGEHQKNVKRLETNRDILKKAISYLQDSRLLELRGLDDKMRKASFLRQKKQFVKDAVGELQLSKVFGDVQIDMYLNKLKIQLKLGSEESDRLNALISEEIGKLGKLEGLLKEIKMIGSQYLELDPLGTNCPMCQTAFERLDLEKRIQSLDLTEVEDDLPQSLNKNRAALKLNSEQLEQWNKEIERIERVYNAYKAYFTDQWPGTLTETASELLRIINSISETDNEIQKLREVAELARLSGKSEQDLRILENSLESVLNRPIIVTIEDKSLLESTQDGIENEISLLESTRSKILEQRYAIGIDIKNLLDYPAEEQIDVKRAEETLNREGDKILAFQRYFQELGNIIVLEPTASITALKSTSDNLRENIAIHREATKAEVEISAARKLQADSQKYIQENNVKHERLKKAYETLTELCKPDDSQNHLNEFFDQNFSEISDIFMSIHMPREFVSLKFDGRAITLKDDEGEMRKVTEISTGQRSALALSIFLSLNKKLTNGPDLIMFDDPVAFIDDFNALSFLDYLRNFVLTSGKQIFFATANTRLAGLFEKKFSFLGDEDFVTIKLDR